MKITRRTALGGIVAAVALPLSLAEAKENGPVYNRKEIEAAIQRVKSAKTIDEIKVSHQELGEYTYEYMRYGLNAFGMPFTGPIETTSLGKALSFDITIEALSYEVWTSTCEVAIRDFYDWWITNKKPPVYRLHIYDDLTMSKYNRFGIYGWLDTSPRILAEVLSKPLRK